MKNSSKIKLAIKNYRESKGLSQKDLGEKLHVYQSTVMRWEHNAKTIRPSHWSALEPFIREYLEELDGEAAIDFLRTAENLNLKNTPFAHLKNELDNLPKDKQILLKEWDYLSPVQKKEIIEIVLGKSSANKLAEAKSAAGE